MHTSKTQKVQRHLNEALSLNCSEYSVAVWGEAHLPKKKCCLLKSKMIVDSRIFPAAVWFLRLVLHYGRLQVERRSVARLHLILIVPNWNDRAKDFTECVFHLFPGIPPS